MLDIRHSSDVLNNNGTFLHSSVSNCKFLSIGHLSKEYKRSKACVQCGEVNVHHRSLCPKKFNQPNDIPISQETEQSGDLDENVYISTGEIVLMQTAKAEVSPLTYQKRNCTILLDSGSKRT